MKLNEMKENNNMIGGKNKDFDIVQFIKKSDFETIKGELLNKIYNNSYCTEKLGEGYFGKVYSPVIGKQEKVETNGKTISLPIVVKEIQDPRNTEDIFIEQINKKIYIYSPNNITMEAIILSYTNKLWHKKLSPHLPFMIGYSCCDNDKKIC